MAGATVRCVYPGNRAAAKDAFRRDSATLTVQGWRPVDVEWSDTQLFVTYHYQGPAASPWRALLRELWKPFAYGIVLAALILVVLVPLLHWASH